MKNIRIYGGDLETGLLFFNSGKGGIEYEKDLSKGKAENRIARQGNSSAKIRDGYEKNGNAKEKLRKAKQRSSCVKMRVAKDEKGNAT